MHLNTINIEHLNFNSNRQIIDVRSPSEYLNGHIPGAINLPLFSDEERAIVGTLYRQSDPEKALLKGLELVGPKLRNLVEDSIKISPNKSVILYCWRGGQRSQSVAWLLNQANFNVEILDGGYKSYRHWILNTFQYSKFEFIVLAGKTGSGKTQILRKLEELGEQVIDLEGLACHKGSAFGAIGEKEQPSFEQFGNNLHHRIQSMDRERIIWLESESKAIGLVRIPDLVWQQITGSRMIELKVDKKNRIKHLVKVYADYPKQELVDSFRKISKRLGLEKLEIAIQAIEEKNYELAAEIALFYYDKKYSHSLQAMNTNHYEQFPVEEFEFDLIARDLIILANKDVYEK
ncbi:MAG: tRNA 2-selenouridine(34) synthase MnmH [Saprospiraceae bacterium]|nr:tRNA 2-selenouridine(34) synthase MnmH [Saprospiraceae bacterium]